MNTLIIIILLITCIASAFKMGYIAVKGLGYSYVRKTALKKDGTFNPVFESYLKKWEVWNKDHALFNADIPRK